MEAELWARTGLLVVCSQETPVADAADWLTDEELAFISRRRRGAAAGLAARSAGKAAIRRAFAGAGMPEPLLPHPREISFRPDRRGRLEAELPVDTVEWLRARGSGLDVSLAHERSRGFAAAVVAGACDPAPSCR